MPDASEFVVFEVNFSGTTTAKNTVSPDSIENTVRKLNEQADTIAKELQNEVAEVFQPLTSGQVIVHAEVKFRSGTIVVEGLVIAVLTAMGTIASQAISQALGQNLASLLQRRLNWFFGQRHQQGFGNDANQYPHITIDVGAPRIRWSTPQPDIQEMRMPQLGEANQPWLQVWQQAFPRPNFEETTNAQQSSGANWLLPAIAVGTTITTALLAVVLTIVILVFTN